MVDDDALVEEFRRLASPDWTCPKCGAENAYFWTNCPAYENGEGCYQPKPEDPEE